MKKTHWYDFISINLFWLGLNIRNNAVGNILMPYLVAGFVGENLRISPDTGYYSCSAPSA